MLIDLIASDNVIDAAYQWMCEKRAHHHFNSDVWQVRRWWDEKKPLLQQQLRSGTYQFRELRQFWGEDQLIEYWSSQDALVLKAMSIVLTEHLYPHLTRNEDPPPVPLFDPPQPPLEKGEPADASLLVGSGKPEDASLLVDSGTLNPVPPLLRGVRGDRYPFHLAGSGGMKGAVREVAANLAENEFVFRTDVKGYYASINHDILMEIVGRYVHDEKVLVLLWGYLRRFVSDGGKFIDITQGISLGCPLSPLMGALFLKPLDDRMAELGCFYARFMDDWVILAPTRWKLRKAIKAVNEVMAELQVEKHPDKTFIGRIARGFDFLGYWFSPSGLSVALKTLERMLVKVSRLYEQGADDIRIETYRSRWWQWVRSGVVGLCDRGRNVGLRFGWGLLTFKMVGGRFTLPN